LDWHSTLLNGINGGNQRVIALGINWYLNNNVKLQLNDLITDVSRYTSTTHILTNNASQSFNTVGVRLQFTN
jgi:phosphate-selective porin OprO/OprP